MIHTRLSLALFSLFLISCSHSQKSPQPLPDDKYLWLEQIEDTNAIEWVKAQNKESESRLKSHPEYAQIEKEVRDILLARDRIPSVTHRGHHLYNLWQDSKNVRGLWRRTTLNEFKKKNPKWETILDLDALAKKENENWVYKGSSCLEPQNQLCLIVLSRGGKDASVVREFDVKTKSFVKNGFFLPEAKSNVAWIDENTLFVGTDFGPGTLTQSGYPRQVKLWKRGTELSEAKLIFEGTERDMGVYGFSIFRPEGNYHFVGKRPSFFEEENYYFDPKKETLTPLPFPKSSDFQNLFKKHLLTRLRLDWGINGRTYPRGSIVSLPLDFIFSKNPTQVIELVYAPSENQALLGVHTSKDAIYLSILEDVQSKILKGDIRPERATGNTFLFHPLDIPDFTQARISSSSSFSDDIYLLQESFLASPELRLMTKSEKSTTLKTLPPRFRSEGIHVEQLFAKSRDGTSIPYFVIGPKTKGAAPTLLYGYGGFEIPQTPFYLGTIGKVWLERGGRFVLANIRGGGEFGPRWHQEALKDKRQTSFDDFIAIAEDLVSRGLTSNKDLTIQGGSNGGLLVGAVMIQRPDLFGKVICSVPLLDMLRYHLLLAGPSWVGEYGHPDDPKIKGAIESYSPFRNVKASHKYPEVFFVTSTKDDRVHPGHARKMVAKMLDLGHKPIYFENMEGGHSAAANLEQRVKLKALEYAFLFKKD